MTGTEIELYVKSLVTASPLKGLIKGGIYTQGLRPPDSIKEDIVITFASGLDNQISTGVVLVNAYVPDIDSGKGLIQKDAARCLVIEKAIAEFRKSLPTNEFLWQPDTTITSNPVPEVRQHYINLRLKYRLWQN